MSVYGLDMTELPETYTPLDAMVVLKCLDEEGDVVLVTRSSDDLKIWDRVGMLTVALDLARTECRESFVSDADEDEDKS